MATDTLLVEKATTNEAAPVNGAIPPAITIDAIYLLDDYLEPIAVKHVASVNDPVPFDPDDFYRVYFEHSPTPQETDYDDDCPHADIFRQSDGPYCVEYTFRPTATPAEVERLELRMKTRKFQRSALQRWGGFKLLWGGPGGNDTFDVGANLLVYYDDELAFVTLRRVGVQPGLTFAELLADYQFLLAVPVRPQKPANALDIDKARQELMSFLEVDPEEDDPDFLYDWIMPT
jgi:hypothetical protein